MKEIESKPIPESEKKVLKEQVKQEYKETLQIAQKLEQGIGHHSNLGEKVTTIEQLQRESEKNARVAINLTILAIVFILVALLGWLSFLD